MRRAALALTLVATWTLSHRAWATPSVPSDAGTTPAAPADRLRDPWAPEETNERITTRLGGFATGALGMPGVDFVNALVGARVELEYTPRFAFGLSLAYANLRGKDGRVSNVLPEASMAYNIPLGDSGVRVPIRFAGGYLPKNGPTLRLTSGFDWSLSDSIALEIALLEPMVWVARDRPELSLNFGVAVLGRF